MHRGGQVVRRHVGAARRARQLGLAVLFGVAAVCTPSSVAAQGAKAAPTVRAGRVVTDSLWSYALGTYKPVVVYLPPSYDRGKTRYPVVYYLHGYSGSEINWTKSGKLDTSLDTLIAHGTREMIVVMPDGDDSWWMTWESLPDLAGCLRTLPAYAGDGSTFCVPWPHYDDYVAYDVVHYADTKYRTIADRAHRGIAGLSMGGYGAIMLALRFPLIFGAAASHSGVVWPLEWAPDGVYQRSAGMPDSLWTRLHSGGVAKSMQSVFGKDTTAWYSRDPAHLADRVKASGAPMPALKADCGTSDVYVYGNRALRDALATRGVPLVYNEYPGTHNWEYWRTHARESLAWLAAQMPPR